MKHNVYMGRKVMGRVSKLGLDCLYNVDTLIPGEAKSL
jgi:hypothetical protein